MIHGMFRVVSTSEESIRCFFAVGEESKIRSMYPVKESRYMEGTTGATFIGNVFNRDGVSLVACTNDDGSLPNVVPVFDYAMSMDVVTV